MPPLGAQQRERLDVIFPQNYKLKDCGFVRFEPPETMLLWAMERLPVHSDDVVR